MLEPEIQPLGSLVLAVVNIVNLLFTIEFSPSLLSPLVPLDVPKLDKYKQEDVVSGDTQEHLITRIIYN